MIYQSFFFIFTPKKFDDYFFFLINFSSKDFPTIISIPSILLMKNLETTSKFE